MIPATQAEPAGSVFASGDTTDNAALAITGLSKTYANGKTALQEVSLTVPRGSFYALLGPNGAGKSTLINILAGIVRPGTGSVSLFGRDLFMDDIWCKRHMGVVPQEIAFDPFFTPREILVLTLGLYGKPVDTAWIDELMSHLGLSEHSGKTARQLSGGMRRRLLVAQALVHRPPLAILDEPTAGVDVELRHRLWTFMRQLNSEGTTILLTTHYLDEAEELCDRVAILNEGHLLHASGMKELLTDVAASHLWLRYGQAVALDADARTALDMFEPWLMDAGHVLCLRLKRQADHGSTFHDAYMAAVARFGAPLDAGVEQEDLEDVFLRLTRHGVDDG